MCKCPPFTILVINTMLSSVSATINPDRLSWDSGFNKQRNREKREERSSKTDTWCLVELFVHSEQQEEVLKGIQQPL